MRLAYFSRYAVRSVGFHKSRLSAAEGWNETEPPLNISVVTEAINVSEDLLEDDNESTELDGNLSDANLASVSLRTGC